MIDPDIILGDALPALCGCDKHACLTNVQAQFNYTQSIIHIDKVILQLSLVTPALSPTETQIAVSSAYMFALQCCKQLGRSFM